MYAHSCCRAVRYAGRSFSPVSNHTIWWKIMFVDILNCNVVFLLGKRSYPAEEILTGLGRLRLLAQLEWWGKRKEEEEEKKKG